MASNKQQDLVDEILGYLKRLLPQYEHAPHHELQLLKRVIEDIEKRVWVGDEDARDNRIAAEVTYWVSMRLNSDGDALLNDGKQLVAAIWGAVDDVHAVQPHLHPLDVIEKHILRGNSLYQRESKGVTQARDHVRAVVLRDAADFVESQCRQISAEGEVPLRTEDWQSVVDQLRRQADGVTQLTRRPLRVDTRGQKG